MSNLIYSQPAYIFNATEPTDANVEFVYNFYDSKETSAPFDIRDGIDFSENVISGEFENKYRIDFSVEERSKIARFNKISWKIDGVDSLIDRIPNPIRIKNNFNKILREGSIPFNSFEPINLPARDLPDRHFALAQFLKLQMTGSNLLEFGLSDKILSTDINQPVGVKGEIPKIFNQENLNVIMNKKFNFDIFEGVTGDPLSPFEEELLGILRNPSEEDDYNFKIVNEIPNIGMSITSQTPFLVGYIVDKWEVRSDGSLIGYPPIVVKNPQLKEIIDIDVLYGKTYTYKIKSVFLVTIPALPGDNSTLDTPIQYLKILVTSRDVDLWINCEERIPPPPPQDIDFSWRENEGLMIVWNLPHNPQRDIKRIQVFRRESVNHPFELIREIRFNDNLSPAVESGIPEDIPNDVIVSTDKPYNIKHIIDSDFNKDSKFIYSLCSVDAHFYTSNYSNQYEVSYDKTFNQLNNRLISLLGAPKPYPNLFLEDEGLILNSLKVDGKISKRAKIIFSPEFLKCYKTDQAQTQIEQLKILKSTNGSYNFQIINLDNQNKFEFIFKLDGTVLG